MAKTNRRILAIETSSSRLSLALGDGERVLASYRGPSRWRHAEVLVNAMKKVLAKARVKPHQISGVLVTTGPGSFTGIRIGLAAARAFGQGLSIPVRGIDSLEIMAQAAPERDGLICPLIDALRGDVFVGLYQKTVGRLRTVTPAKRSSLDELIQSLQKYQIPVQFCGEAAGRFKPKLSAYKMGHFLNKQYDVPSALVLLRRGSSELSSRDRYEKILPLYLRGASAEERCKSSQ